MGNELSNLAHHSHVQGRKKSHHVPPPLPPKITEFASGLAVMIICPCDDDDDDASVFLHVIKMGVIEMPSFLRYRNAFFLAL